jgi:hypothetical protein
MDADRLSEIMASIGECLDRFGVHLRADEREPARAAVCEGLLHVERDFAELSTDERCAGWLRGSLHALASGAAWVGLESPDMAERYVRAMMLRLLLTLRYGPV